VILSTFPDMVESELGSSIHEERIITQRDNKPYKGYIPVNVEFLVEYLFAVGFSPKVHVDYLPIKLWGRYLPDTVISHIRDLYQIPNTISCTSEVLPHSTTHRGMKVSGRISRGEGEKKDLVSLSGRG